MRSRPRPRRPLRGVPALALALLAVSSASAIDLATLVAAAATEDVEMQRLALALTNAELDERLRELGEGLALTIGGAGGSTIATSFDLANQTTTVSGGVGLSATLPSPFETAVSVSVPLSYSSATDTFDADVSVSLSQPLEPLLNRAIVGSHSAADVVAALALLRARAAIEQQRLAIHRELVGELGTVVAQRRTSAAARQRADVVERDIETKRLLRQLEPGSFAEARLLADLEAERRTAREADALRHAAIGELLERTARASGMTVDQLNALGIEDAVGMPRASLPLAEPAPPLSPPVLEAAMELRRARLAEAEQRVDALPDLSLSASYDITGEALSASATVSLTLLRQPLRLAAEQRANDVSSAELGLTAALQAYRSQHQELADRVAAQLQDTAVAANELEILRLQLDETLAAVDAGVNDSAAADQARWQLGDASEALLSSLLVEARLAADVAELSLLERVGVAEQARRTLEELAGSAE